MLFHFVKRGPPLARCRPLRSQHPRPDEVPADDCTAISLAPAPYVPPRRQLLTWAVRPRVSLHLRCSSPCLLHPFPLHDYYQWQYVPLQRSRFCRLYLRSRVVVAGAACADADADAAAACAAAVWRGAHALWKESAL